MFREIRGVEQRSRTGERRWFQNEYFDLFCTVEKGELQWFQLCYARDTWRERVLEWRRSGGFQHLKVKDRMDPIRKDSNELVLDGPFPSQDVASRFEASAKGLPPEIGAFVAGKIQEYERAAGRIIDSREPGR